MNSDSNPFISGKVVLQDGSPLTESVAIQSVCNGRKHVEAYTDSSGSFLFQFAAATTGMLSSGLGEGDNSMRSTDTLDGRIRNFRNCDLRAVLQGFTSDSVNLSSSYSGGNSARVGNIVLRRVGGVSGTTISTTTAAAPESATHAFLRGREDQKKSRWDAAEKHFQEAIRIYAQYAPAWFELGRTQVLQNNPAAAQQSFEQALKADPKFVSPYQALAELAARQEHWAEVVKFTDAVLALNPTDFPQVWFMNAIGNFDLHQLAAGEKSVREGLRLDVQHQMPRMEYLLSLILAQRQQYHEAAEHMTGYLKLATTPAEIADAQSQLRKLSHLAAITVVPAVEETASTATPK